MIEVVNSAAASSLFADEELLRCRDDPAATNGELDSNDEPAESPANLSPEPRGSSVIFSSGDEKEAEPSDNPNHHDIIGYSKQSTRSCYSVGVTEVHERAPNINLRMFRQAERRKPRRNGGKNLLHKLKESSSSILTSKDKRHKRNETNESNILLEAHLVEEEELEYAVAEEISFLQRNSKILVFGLCFFVILLVTLVTVSVTQGWGVEVEMPSEMPSVAPSQDPRPTLAIVQERGYLLCELFPNDMPVNIFRKEICRSIAAVVLGNPDSFKAVDPPPHSERWTGLQGASVDVMIKGDTRTVEREVNEGLTFSTPYYYDGGSYNGKELYVSCAYDRKRHDECEDLFICAIGSAGDYIEDHFSPEFYHIGTSIKEHHDMYRNGSKTFTNEPLAIVTRNDEAEWSDIVNWVMQALFYGEKVGRGRNQDKCSNDTATVASKLNYLNAVDCVGELATNYFNSVFVAVTCVLTHNNSKSEMLYVTPFGKQYDDDAEDEPNQVRLSMLHNLLTREIRCGIVVHSGCEDGDITASNKICGMSVDLCHTLAASIHYGNANAVNFTIYQDEDGALIGLNNGTIDVLLGFKNDLNSDFGNEVFCVLSLVYFIKPDREPATVYSIATLDNDPVFASYVNSIILATVYAVHHGITQDSTVYMPAMTLFGKYFLWALKDVIEANGNYDEIYRSNFGNVKSRGRNALNKRQSPQMINNPGLVSKPFPASGAFQGRLNP
eukprot:scaffold29126_cov67-Cyclotella_meneghiniana.AAC.2